MRTRPGRRNGSVATLAVVWIVLPMLAVVGARWSVPSRVAAQVETRPNAILIVLDDLDAASVAQMPNVVALLRDQGTSFANFFASTPLCCPSRASILRGQYVHNHGTLHHGKGSGFTAFFRLGREASTAATWLKETGYRTALYGKYLNGYPTGADPLHVPPGWDEWASGTMGKEPYGGFDYQLNENGRLVSYGSRPEEYATDVFAAKASDFISRSAASERPFFLYLAPYAPHLPATPAPRHATAFADAQAPRTPSFAEADTSDKPAWVRGMPNLESAQERQVDEVYRQRLRSLLAVDEMVASLVETLGATGILENTFVFFTSDNGFHLGEHRLPEGKQTPYEESIRVPLIVRGPGVPVGASVDDLTLNTDLAPTLATLARAVVPEFVDGRSLASYLGQAVPQTAPRHAVLVEHFGAVEQWERHATRVAGELEDLAAGVGEHGLGLPVPPYYGPRTADLLYVEYATGDRELYDLRADPYQLDNLAQRADPALLERLSARLAELRACSGPACHRAEDAPLDRTQGP